VEREYSEEEQAMAEVSVPAVVGMDSASAQVKMNQTGLNFVVRGSGSTVTYQYPAGGTAIARQSTIVLYTDEGAGPSLVKVPNVVGQSYDTAMRVLQQAGLNMQAKGALVDSASVQCSAQSVAEGTEVEEGTIIEVTFMDTTNYSD
ncbi:MAG: PASTA domain-containing protein, partial [Ruthenibacterium sp.]